MFASKEQEKNIFPGVLLHYSKENKLVVQQCSCMTAGLRLVVSLGVDNASKYKHESTAKGWSFTSFSGRINIIQL